MRRLGSGVLTMLAAAMLAAFGAAARAQVPTVDRLTLVEATVCMLPGAACPDPDEVLRLIVRGSEHRVGVTDLVVLDGSVTSGTIFSELRLRPTRLFAPDEELAKLTPGTPLRMRAVVRLGARYLFAESLSAIGDD